MAGITTTSMMTGPRHNSFVAAKAEAPTRVGHMTGLAETASGGTTKVALEVLGHGAGLMILMEM